MDELMHVTPDAVRLRLRHSSDMYKLATKEDNRHDE